MSKYNTSFSFKDTIPGDALIMEMCPPDIGFKHLRKEKKP